MCSFWRTFGHHVPKIFNSDSPIAGNYPEKIIRQDSEGWTRMCILAQGCSSESCYVITECLLPPRGVYGMTHSGTGVKQHLRRDPIFARRSVPLTVCDIDVPSL